MPNPLLFAAPLMTCSLAAAAPITTGDLVGEMTDLGVLVEQPEPMYKTTQFSSYDRTSVEPYAPGWYANSDGFGREPTPNFLEVLDEPGEDGIGRYLMVDVDGPGALVRFWTAAINGDVALYLDGGDEPIWEGSAGAFLGRTYSELAMKAGLISEPVGEGFRQAQSCYFPIPFQEGCRIEWTGDVQKIHFYQVEARHYPPGTEVQTFSLEDLKTCETDIARALEIMREPDTKWTSGAETREEVAGDVTASPGEREELLRLEGGGVVTKLSVKTQADDLHRSLRATVLRIYFDGAPQPQVESPLGDFFSSGPGVSPLDTLPFTVRPDGTMVCRFAMPYRESAVFELRNLGSEDVRVIARAEVADYDWRDEESLHFHAKWRVDHDLTAAGGNEAYDLPYLCARGKGTLVGVACMLMNPGRIPTSGGNWWGEGDEKIYLDDDRFPSLFGTGSEDYYNYAWSRPGLFDYAYCAQPLDTGPDNRGFVTNSRFHILDPLPFQQSIDFYMELFHHTPTPGLTYARIAYFYAEPWTRDDHVPPTPLAVTSGLDLPENWLPLAGGAARGATFYQAEDCLAPGNANAEVVTDVHLWSAGKLVQWTPTAEGETLSLKLNVEKAGKYQVVATCAVTPTSGRVGVSMDGGEEMRPVHDLHTPYHTMVRNFFFNEGDDRVVELDAGEHALTFHVRGKNDASGGTDIGIDFVWLLAR